MSLGRVRDVDQHLGGLGWECYEQCKTRSWDLLCACQERVRSRVALCCGREIAMEARPSKSKTHRPEYIARICLFFCLARVQAVRHRESGAAGHSASSVHGSLSRTETSEAVRLRRDSATAENVACEQATRCSCRDRDTRSVVGRKWTMVRVIAPEGRENKQPRATGRAGGTRGGYLGGRVTSRCTRQAARVAHGRTGGRREHS